MRYTRHSITTGAMILANDHYTAKPYDCTGLSSLATDGIIPAGTIIPSNDSSAAGVLLSDVRLSENPNGTIVTHGFIHLDKLPTAPSEDARSALPMMQFI